MGPWRRRKQGVLEGGKADRVPLHLTTRTVVLDSHTSTVSSNKTPPCAKTLLYHPQEQLGQELLLAGSMATKLHGDHACGISLDPLHYIPLEVAGEIFKIYMALPRPSELDNLSGHGRDSYVLPSPYILCLVCTSWQALAVDLPILWSNVMIYTLWDSVKQGYTVRENHGRALREWANRIRGHPWSLDLSLAANRDGPSPYAPLLDILSLTRIANLQFVKAPGSVFMMPELRRTSFPKLRSLVLSEDGTPLYFKFSVYPELEKASIVSVRYHNLSWQSLTHLYIGTKVPLDVNDFVRVVTTGLRLQCLCFSTWPGTGSMPSNFRLLSDLSSQTPKISPSVNLTDLTLVNNSPFNTPLPATISWPNLKRLRLLTDRTSSVGRWHDSNLRLLQSLTHLQLSSLELRVPLTGTIGPLLGACHLLTHLHVDVLVTKAFYQLFQSLDCNSASHDHGTLLPHLESLKIDCRTGESHPGIPHDLLYNMVASRVAFSPATGLPLTPLKYFAFRIYHPDPNMPCTLRDELSKGLEEFRTQIDLSISITQCDNNYSAQTAYRDADHWDRGFGAFIETLGEF